MTVSESDQKQLWRTFSRALGAELRDQSSVRGASGIDHPVQAIAVDDKEQRVIIFSAEPNPRIAALIQGDIQSTLPNAKVLVARPIVLDVGAIIRGFFKNAEEAKISLNQLSDLGATFNSLSEEDRERWTNAASRGVLQSTMKAVEHVRLPSSSQWNLVFQQLLALDWTSILASFQDQTTPISFTDIYNLDTIAIDREYGVCPIPLYEFQVNDWDLFFRGTDIEHVQQRLKQLNIFQYFFPSPDQLALGAVERGLTKREEIVNLVRSSDELGHPLGASELIAAREIPDLIDALAERGYLAEVDHTVRVTPAGAHQRLLIKTRPRESALSKFLQRFKVNISLRASTKDFSSHR